MNGKVAIVTGGSRDIGLQVSLPHLWGDKEKKKWASLFCTLPVMLLHLSMEKVLKWMEILISIKAKLKYNNAAFANINSFIIFFYVLLCTATPCYFFY